MWHSPNSLRGTTTQLRTVLRTHWLRSTELLHLKSFTHTQSKPPHSKFVDTDSPLITFACGVSSCFNKRSGSTKAGEENMRRFFCFLIVMAFVSPIFAQENRGWGFNGRF